MRKALFSLVFGVFLTAAPVFAQHGHGGGGRASSGRSSGGHAQAQPRSESRPAPARPGFNGGSTYHPRTAAPEVRSHWNGHAFDRAYFAAHWGPAHPFYWGRAEWWGPRWYVGSRFWFGGVWFSVIDPIPSYWYNDEVTVIYDEDCGCYYAVDPVYPGVRIHIGVAF
jgi:hypothetical protein